MCCWCYGMVTRIVGAATRRAWWLMRWRGTSPVIHVNTYAALPTQFLWTGLSDAEIKQPSVEVVRRAPANTAIAQLVAALTVPPEHKMNTRMLTQFYRE